MIHVDVRAEGISSMCVFMLDEQAPVGALREEMVRLLRPHGMCEGKYELVDAMEDAVLNEEESLQTQSICSGYVLLLRRKEMQGALS